MPKEIQEDLFLKWKSEEVGHLKTFYAPTVSNVVETWKRKSVSIISPKSGRILRQKTRPRNEEKKRTEQKDLGFFSRIFEDLKKAKVSDYEYQQSKVRENSSYKPFWATKVVSAKVVTPVELETEIKTVSLNENCNATVNKNLVFQKEMRQSPKVTLTRKATKPTKAYLKKLSAVDLHKEYKLKMPPSYNGSKMYMPTGERLFWVRYFNKTISFNVYYYQGMNSIIMRL